MTSSRGVYAAAAYTMIYFSLSLVCVRPARRNNRCVLDGVGEYDRTAALLRWGIITMSYIDGYFGTSCRLCEVDHLAV